MKLFNTIFFLGVLLLIFSCNETDDVGPIITMNGSDSVRHVLNTIYVDEGATATDETDGNVTDNIYVDNQVNENLVGVYSVIYKVIDEAGNEAKEAVREVHVYNEGETYNGNYNLTEIKSPDQDTTCQYDIYTWIDSTVNHRLTFDNFACDAGFNVYADVYDSIVEMPLQLLEDSLISFSVQGNGSINDSVILIDYILKSGDQTTYWEAEFLWLE